MARVTAAVGLFGIIVAAGCVADCGEAMALPAAAALEPLAAGAPFAGLGRAGGLVLVQDRLILGVPDADPDSLSAAQRRLLEELLALPGLIPRETTLFRQTLERDRRLSAEQEAGLRQYLDAKLADIERQRAAAEEQARRAEAERQRRAEAERQAEAERRRQEALKQQAQPQPAAPAAPPQLTAEQRQLLEQLLALEELSAFERSTVTATLQGNRRLDAAAEGQLRQLLADKRDEAQRKEAERLAALQEQARQERQRREEQQRQADEAEQDQAGLQPELPPQADAGDRPDSAPSPDSQPLTQDQLDLLLRHPITMPAPI
jgi:hypothetical protein